MKKLGLILLCVASVVGCGVDTDPVDGDVDIDVIAAAPETVEEDAEAGDTVTSDTEDNGVTRTDPVETSVKVTRDGKVSIDEMPIDEEEPAGIAFIGQQIVIEAPDGTPEEPLILAFTLHESVVPEDLNEKTIQIFRNGKLAPNCTGDEGVASPDPCVSERENNDGDLSFVVLTSKASTWNFGYVMGAGGAKGEIDIAQLKADDWPVVVDGDIATVSVPFAQPVPATVYGVGDPEDELNAAVFMLVRSDESGANVNLTSGTMVMGDPTGPGEYTWELNDARDEATLTFWNESNDGLTLKTDRRYTVQIAVSDNAFVKSLDSTTFKVQPE